MAMLTVRNTLALLMCVMSSAAGQECLTNNHMDAQDGQYDGACESYIAQGIFSCEADAFFGGQYAGM